jgi:hypothetical protein
MQTVFAGYLQVSQRRVSLKRFIEEQGIVPYKTYEHIPNHSLLTHVWGNYSPDELEASNQEVIEYLDKAQGLVHLVTDFRKMTGYPVDINKLSKTFTLFAHPKMGWEIVIAEDQLVKFLSTMVVQIVKRRNNRQGGIKVVSTPEEALAVLEHIAPYLGKPVPFPETA